MAADLKLIAIPELTYIAEINGEPAAFAVALPNINELIREFKGKLARSSSASCSGGSRSKAEDRPLGAARHRQEVSRAAQVRGSEHLPLLQTE